MKTNRFSAWLWALALLVSLGLASPPAALAGPVFLNVLGAPVKEVYGAAPGNTPWKLAGPLEDGQKAEMDDTNLHGCGRLLIAFNDTVALQFFTISYLAPSETVTLRRHRVRESASNEFPQLVVHDGGQDFPVPAGLLFRLLQGDMEADMLTEARYAEWLNPLGLKNAEIGPFAVNLGDVSWSIAPDTAKFAESGKGGKRLQAISLTAPVDGGTLTAVLDELESCGAQPLLLTLEPNKAMAFSKDGLALNPKAVMSEATGQTGGPWAALREQLEKLDGESIPEETTALDLVFASEALRYTLRLEMGQDEARLDMARP